MKKLQLLVTLVVAILVFVLLQLLFGCQTVWRHSYKSTQDFYSDKMDCSSYSSGFGTRQQAPGDIYVYTDKGRMMDRLAQQNQQYQKRMDEAMDGWNAAVRQQSAFNDCMRAKGWNEVQQ